MTHVSQCAIPDDTLWHVMTLKMCGEPDISDIVRTVAYYTDPKTRERQSTSFAVNLPYLLESPAAARSSRGTPLSPTPRGSRPSTEL